MLDLSILLDLLLYIDNITKSHCTHLVASAKLPTQFHAMKNIIKLAINYKNSF